MMIKSKTSIFWPFNNEIKQKKKEIKSVTVRTNERKKE